MYSFVLFLDIFFIYIQSPDDMGLISQKRLIESKKKIIQLLTE